MLFQMAGIQLNLTSHGVEQKTEGSEHKINIMIWPRVSISYVPVSNRFRFNMSFLFEEKKIHEQY